jgi:ferric iron reductase protein FhuF
MTAAISPPAPSPLAPVTATLDAMRLRHGDAPVIGFVPGPVADLAGWTPATELVTGAAIPALLDTAAQRWNAQPHAAAALAWKCYTYWLALPAALGYAAAGRVPLLHPENVVVRFATSQPFLTIGLRRIQVAVRADDPIAAYRLPGVRVVPDDAALRAALRHSIVDRHLAPMMERIREHVHLGRRTLWGSLASGVAHGLSRANDALPRSTMDAAHTLLTTLDVRDLVDLTALPSGELRVHRRTCCLAFTLPVPKVCAGCCIRDA